MRLSASLTPPRPEPRPTTCPSRCRYAGEAAAAAGLRAVRPTRSSVERTHTIRQIREEYDGQELEPDTRTGERVAITGRVIFQRNTGKLCFARLREGDGSEIQVMLSLADVGEESLADFKALVDIGDLLAVRGEVITSRRGELSVVGRPSGSSPPRRCARCPTSTGRSPTRPASGCATST